MKGKMKNETHKNTKYKTKQKYMSKNYQEAQDPIEIPEMRYKPKETSNHKASQN